MKIQKRTRISEKEYSKIWMNKWQLFVMFWCSVFFIADIICNGAEHSVELCICLVTSIAAIFIPYLAKSYFGKKNEERMKLVSNEKLNNEFGNVLESMEDDLK